MEGSGLENEAVGLGGVRVGGAGLGVSLEGAEGGWGGGEESVEGVGLGDVSGRSWTGGGGGGLGVVNGGSWTGGVSVEGVGLRGVG